MDDAVPPFPAVLETGPRFAVLAGLRAYAGELAELARHSARRMSLHTTDLDALVEVFKAERMGDPLSPARLAEHVKLTSGATNALINRLEKVGYVIRSREHADRRQVTLRATTTARSQADAVNARPAQLLEDAFGRLEPATIDMMAEVMNVLTETLRQINAEMAGTPPTGANPPDRREMSPDLRLTGTGSLADHPTEGPT
jgi:DNA-binding MarR family transcriptional regulator